MGMVIQEVCPRCKSSEYKQNGYIHNELVAGFMSRRNAAH